MTTLETRVRLMDSPPIPAEDYQRIFNLIASVIRSEGADPLTSCLYFACIGAVILRDHYGAHPRIRAGIAGYRIGDDEKNVVMFADPTQRPLTCSEDGFHAWIEVDGWVIDFMSPLFGELLARGGGPISAPAKMFQKRTSQAALSVGELRAPGDFFLEENPNGFAILDRFTDLPVNDDLAELASRSYTRPPAAIQREFLTADSKGGLRRVALSTTAITGAW
jgi:hypothetical protein